jgi:hypothetical protein
VVLPNNRGQATKAAQINFANTSTVAALTQAATQGIKSPTALPPTLNPTVTVTLKPSFTPVLAIATSTQAPLQESTLDPRTATVSALLTQAAAAKQTGTAPPTATGLPTTGFAEDIGLPSLLGLALVFIIVIFLVRRLRASPSA